MPESTHSADDTLLTRVLRHPRAPIWNHRAEGHLDEHVLAKLRRFRAALEAPAPIAGGLTPDRALLEWVADRCAHSPFFYARVTDDALSPRGWFNIPTMSREDVVSRIEEIIPDDAPHEERREYRTTGTTGHPVSVPHGRFSVAAYQPLLEYALSLCGIACPHGSGEISGFLIGAQERTLTYATTLGYFGDAVFAKLNLDAGQWRRADDAAAFLREFNPPVLTGDPISFSELLKLGADLTPRALITTAVALSDGLRGRLQEHFRCPVIDWYSLTEIGPIGAMLPGQDRYRVLARDLFLECLDAEGYPVLPGNVGEIAVTGGRNPFLPLLRYRTGDFGRLERGDDGILYVAALEGRAPVVFRKADGSRLNSADVSGCLRPFPIVQYEFSQDKARHCELRLRPAEAAAGLAEELRQRLGALLGDVSMVTVVLDENLGRRGAGSKVIPYRSEVLLEE